MLRSDGLSLLDELRRQEGRHAAMIYAFDLVEHDGEDRRGRSFIDRSAISSSVVESSVSVLPIITMSTAWIGTATAG